MELSTTVKEIMDQLQAPFPAEELEWRIGRAGVKGDKTWATCLAYINNRAIMDRLDNVLGIHNWQNEFKDAPGGGVLCGLSIKIEDEWITKWDGAENTQIEAVKGGLSGAMKRAGSILGIGRYLYQLPEGFAEISDSGKYYQSANKNKGTPAFKWNPPALPGWALPGKSKEKGNHAAAMEHIGSIDNLSSILKFRNQQAMKAWTDAELKEQNKAVKNIEKGLKEKIAC